MNKNFFKNLIDFLSGIKNRTNEKLLLNKIRYGLKNKEFKMHLQFIVDNKTKRIVSGEALSRWETPEGEIIMPGKYRTSPKTPVINVYWDCSGSFLDPAKTAGARAAIDTIKSYVRQGLIAVHVYFHSNEVTLEPQCGGNDGNAVIGTTEEYKTKYNTRRCCI